MLVKFNLDGFTGSFDTATQFVRWATITCHYSSLRSDAGLKLAVDKAVLDNSTLSFACMQYVTGKTRPMLAWAGEPFKVYADFNQAFAAANYFNKVMAENGIKTRAFVSTGILAESGWVTED